MSEPVDKEDMGCLLMMTPFAFGWPFVQAYVLWCGWCWHAQPLGARALDYSVFAAACLAMSIIRPHGGKAQHPRELFSSMVGVYFGAGFVLLALWALRGAL